MVTLFTEPDDIPENWSALSEPSRVHTVVLPIALAFGYLLSKAGFLSMLLWYFVTIPLHETGHAVGAWLGSRFAFPIGAVIPMAGFTMMGEERSFPFGALYFGMTAFTGWWGWRNKSAALVALATLVLPLWFRWTFVATAENWGRFAVWAGVGGEFFLSTFLILLAFYDLPRKLRWDFFRVPAIFYGGFGFAASLARWTSIHAGREDMPMGTFLAGGGDANGDMERLIQVYGWSAAKITRSYLELGVICGLIIGVHWVHTLSRRLRTSQR